MFDTEKKNLRLWLGIVLSIAILMRLALFLTYPAVSYNDTASYRRSAEAILGGLEIYDGTRTPGYPAFLAVVGQDQMVYAVQLFLGLMITLGWFFIGWQISGKPSFGGLTALAHTLNPGQFFFEANLLSETLCTFWLTIAILGAFIWLYKPQFRTIWLGLGIGASAGLATLIRPVFIFFPVSLAIFLSFSIEGKKVHLSWKPLLSILLPAILLIGGWMQWIHAKYDIMSLTTMTGFHLIQHTGYYFEEVSDEYAVLRDVYLEFRDARIAEYGTQGNTIWRAIPALQEASGLNFHDLSRTLQEISVELILSHPWAYLSTVMRGWWLFWRAPVYWDITAVTVPVLASILRLFIFVARGFLFIANMIFVVTSLVGLFSKKLRRIWKLNTFLWLLASSIWGTSILSSILDHGDNPRFLVPLQSVIVFWFLWIAYNSWHARCQVRNTPESYP